MLALSQREHWRAAASLLPYPAPRTLRRLRVIASLLLASALAACVAGHGAGFGMLSWILLVGAGALAVAFVLAWRSWWLGPLAFLMCDTV